MTVDGWPAEPRIDPGQLRDGLVAVQRGLGELRLTHDSDDGLISVTVGGRGEVLELWLDPRVYRSTDSEALAADIVATIQQAADRAGDEAFALARHLLPAGADRDTTDLAFDPVLRELDRHTATRW